MIPHRWRRSAADNGLSDPNVDVRPGRYANTLLGAIRGLMASGAASRDDQIGELVASLSGSTTNVYSVSSNEGLIDITTGIGGVPAAITAPFLLRLSFDTKLAGSATNVPHLKVDGFDCGPILDSGGGSIADGDLGPGRSVLVLGDMAAPTDTKVTRVRVLDLLPSDIAALIPAAQAGTPTGSCRLVYTSPTQLTLIPFNGNQVQVNGAARTVPRAGDANPITLSNAGLTAGTLYYVYLPPTGTALEASTTGHVTAADGTEVKSGDPTRALVGLIYTDGGTPGTFADAPSKRLVDSWFNPPVRVLTGAYVGGATTSTSAVETNSAGRTYFVAFAGRVADGTTEGNMFNTTTGGVNYVNISLDLNFSGPAAVQGQQTGNQTTSDALIARGVFSVTEGYHFLTTTGYTNPGYGATCSFNSAITGRIG